MPVPRDLAAAMAALPEDPRFEQLGGWSKHDGGEWSFHFRVRLSVAASRHVPEWTGWHLVADGEHEDREIRIYPDTVDGITATFPHQDYNAPPIDGRPWRTGKPCLERPASVFQREGWAGEPLDLPDRLVWRIGRLLDWIDAAASGNLLVAGDPLELPMYPAVDVATVLGFRETIDDLNWWTAVDASWGFATVSEVPEAHGTAVISDLMDPHLRSVRRITWSAAITVEEKRVDAVWLILPTFAVFEPWRAAGTWAELTALCAGVSIDLPAIIADAGARLRRIQRPKHASPVRLLIGFPLEAVFGGAPERFHWISVGNMQLCTRGHLRRGFRENPAARRERDIELAKSARPLEWQRTANWAPDQLRKRGEAEEEVRSKSILVIGCGTLGASVAENLLRIGVTRMALLDYDIMHVGNLSRHVLTMADAGRGKAARLAKRLNSAAPDADVIALTLSFPPTEPADRGKLKEWDVVVDCTASDAVLRAMAAFPWVTERV